MRGGVRLRQTRDGAVVLPLARGVWEVRAHVRVYERAWSPTWALTEEVVRWLGIIRGGELREVAACERIERLVLVVGDRLGSFASCVVTDQSVRRTHRSAPCGLADGKPLKSATPLEPVASHASGRPRALHLRCTQVQRTGVDRGRLGQPITPRFTGRGTRKSRSRSGIALYKRAYP